MEKNQQLLIETILFKPMGTGLIVEERADGSKRYLAKGIVQRKGAKNQNGRIYPDKILEAQVESYIKNEIAEKRAYGELDHPSSETVSFQNACFTMEALEWDGNDLIGTLELLDVPSGNIIKNIMLAGKTIGISSRGVGSVKKISEGVVEVQDDFQIIAWDIVTNPSTQGAFVKLVTESKQRRIIEEYSHVNSIIDEILRDNSKPIKLKK